MASQKVINFSIESLISTTSSSSNAKASATTSTNDSNKHAIAGVVERQRATTAADSAFHPALRDAQVTLEDAALWRRFHALGTEMIVTKSGSGVRYSCDPFLRRIFPALRFSIHGLWPRRRYALMIEMCTAADGTSTTRQRYRYSFHQSRWIAAGSGDAELPARIHVHPDSPASGAHWMRRIVAFDRLKLTNNQLDRNGHLIVNSMHRYVPRLRLQLATSAAEAECAGGGRATTADHGPLLRERSFVFAETGFIAVTAYQNHRITELKIECNPFAKGFRESDYFILRTTTPCRKGD